jgi:N-acetylglucosamine malate deacetylase 2
MLRDLYALAGEAAFRAGTLLVCAHPDDETIGAGALLGHLPDPFVVHLTDGAPRERRWWGIPDLPSREAYARLRAGELACALDAAGVPRDRRRVLGFIDQAASLDLLRLVRDVAGLLEELRPGVVLTHPYEGGHPDHDAAAFAVHATCALREREGKEPPVVVVEFTSYHAGQGGIEVGCFLPAEREVVTLESSDEDGSRKRRMLECHASQARTLALFSVGLERFRRAPAYDFTRPPHPGTLYHEQHGWGEPGERWRARAAEALDVLGIGEPARC